MYKHNLRHKKQNKNAKALYRAQRFEINRSLFVSKSVQNSGKKDDRVRIAGDLHQSVIQPLTYIRVDFIYKYS